jgi:hypothetical protein
LPETTFSGIIERQQEVFLARGLDAGYKAMMEPVRGYYLSQRVRNGGIGHRRLAEDHSRAAN